MRKELHDDLEPEQTEFRVYLDERLERWAIVDWEDYTWAVQWKWHINRPHPKRTGKKEYARRTRSNGNPGMNKSPLYLHVEIMKRMKKKKPKGPNIVVDHRDGNELNCRRSNLRYLTQSQNLKHAHKEKNK